MDINIEERFIQNFTTKRVQERLIFELRSPKYRRKAIIRFSKPELLLKNNIIIKEGNNLTIEDVKNEIKKYFDIKQQVYIIADDPSDGLTCDFETAIETVMDDLGTAIIICGEKTAFIKKEVSYGAPKKYILHFS